MSDGGIELNISPTRVNVLTDVILIVLGLIWVRLMITVTKLNIKKDLRKENRIFSFERLGTFSYFTSGRTKLNYMRNKGILEPDVEKHFRLKTLISLLFFTFTLSLISLHVLIDYGLDFRVNRSLTSGTLEYKELIALQSDQNYTTELQRFRELSERRDFCEVYGHIPGDCREINMWAVDHLQQHLREGVGLVKTLYESPSLTQLDIIDALEIDYLALDDSGEVCEVKEASSMTDFDGNLELVGNRECELREASVRRLSLDMRARRRVNMRLDSPASNMLAFYEEVGVDTGIEYISFTNFKNDIQENGEDNSALQEETTVDIRKIDEAVGLNPEHYKFANISVESNLMYEPYQQQTITLTDLTRRTLGVSVDEDFSLPLNKTQGTAVVNTECLQVEDSRMDLQTDLFFQGESCGKIDVVVATGRCDEADGEVRMDGIWQQAQIGIQSMEAIVLIPKDHICHVKAMEKYGDQIESDMFELVVSLRYSLVCTFFSAADETRCAFGPNALQWQDDEWVVPEEDQEESESVNLRVIQSETEINWNSIEVFGGDSSDEAQVEEIASVFRNIEEIFRSYYPELKLHSDEGVTRGRILGVKVHNCMRGVLAAVSSQIGPTSRTMRINKEETVAVLREAYVGGSLAVIGICVAAALLTLIRWIQEYYAYRKMGVQVRVPTTITEWIEAALTTPSDTEKQVAEKPQFFEYTARKVDDDSLTAAERAHSSQTTHLGFWETPEALEARDGDEPNGENPERQSTRERQPSSRRWLFFQ